MKLMAKKQLLVTVLILSMVMFFALPLASFAGGIQGSIKTTDIELTNDANVTYDDISDVYVRADGMSPGNYYIRLINTNGGNTEVGTSVPNANFMVGSDGSLTGPDIYTVNPDTEPVHIVQLTKLISIVSGTVFNGEYKVEVSDNSNFNGKKSDNFKIGDYAALEIKKEVSLTGENDYDDSLTVTSDAVTVDYRFTVTNTGTANLEDVKVYDEDLNWTSEGKSIKAGNEAVYTTTVAISDWDVDGEFNNTAVAKATFKGDPVESAPDSATVNYVIPPDVSRAAIHLDKKVRLADSDTSFADSLTVPESPAYVEYQFTVTNTGNVGFDDVTLKDNMIGVYDLSLGSLPVGQEITTVKAIKINEWVDNQYVNIATAAGIYDNETWAEDDDTATVTLNTNPVEPKPGISVIKTVSPSAVTSKTATVTYFFEVSNTGDQDFDEVELYDWPIGVDNYIEGLDAGETTTVAITFDLGLLGTSGYGDWTEDYDEDRDTFTNKVIATGRYGDGGSVTAEDYATVYYNDEITNIPKIGLVKSVSDSTVYSRSADVTYTFKVTNNGDYDLYNASLNDPFINYTWNIGDLAIGETTSASIDFDLANIVWDGNSFTNTATVSAITSGEDEVTATSSATVDYESSGGGGGDTPRRTTTTTITPEPTPAAPVVETPLIEEPIPAAPLPQTGGIPALLFFGAGGLLAGAGTLLRRKQK